MKDRVSGRFAPLTDLEIEAFLAGEATGEDRRRIEQAAEASLALSDYMQQRKTEMAAYAQAHPALDFDPAQEPGRRAWPAWALGLSTAGVAAAIALVVALFAWPADVQSPGVPNGIQARGSIKAGLTVQRGERVFQHREGVLLRPGDKLRLSVESSRAGYVTLIGRNQRGGMAVYYDGLQTKAGTWNAPDSLVLDEDLQPERWYVLLSLEPTDAADMQERLRRGEPLGMSSAVLTLEKEAAP